MSTAGTAEENRRLIEGLYASFMRWEIPALFQALDENIFWHIPGRGPLSGDYRGHTEVLGFFQRFGSLGVSATRSLFSSQYNVSS